MDKVPCSCSSKQWFMLSDGSIQCLSCRVISKKAKWVRIVRASYEKVCLNCGEKFQAKRSHAKTCSGYCRQELRRKK